MICVLRNVFLDEKKQTASFLFLDECDAGDRDGDGPMFRVYIQWQS